MLSWPPNIEHKFKRLTWADSILILKLHIYHVSSCWLTLSFCSFLILFHFFIFNYLKIKQHSFFLLLDQDFPRVIVIISFMFYPFVIITFFSLIQIKSTFLIVQDYNLGYWIFLLYSEGASYVVYSIIGREISSTRIPSDQEGHPDFQTDNVDSRWDSNAWAFGLITWSKKRENLFKKAKLWKKKEQKENATKFSNTS